MRGGGCVKWGLLRGIGTWRVANCRCQYRRAGGMWKIWLCTEYSTLLLNTVHCYSIQCIVTECSTRQGRAKFYTHMLTHTHRHAQIEIASERARDRERAHKTSAQRARETRKLTEGRSNKHEHKHRQTDRQTSTHMREVVMPQAMSWSSLGLKRGSPRASGRTMSLPVLAAYLNMQLTKTKNRPFALHLFTPSPFRARCHAHTDSHKWEGARNSFSFLLIFTKLMSMQIDIDVHLDADSWEAGEHLHEEIIHMQLQKMMF
jgi:hypothetical protein